MTAEEQGILKKKFGKHLRKIRQSKGLSLLDVSYACSLDSSNIGKMEKGMINVALTTIVELAKGLDVHPTELLNYDSK